MKQFAIKHPGNSRLLLFFAGWGMDERLIDFPIMEGYDCMVCHDYRTLAFDSSELKNYQSIRVVAWSMGVWVAGRVLSGLCLPWEQKIAFNGTSWPIDDERGIPVTVFQGTLEGFSATTLAKFRRRMCGSATALNKFMQSVTARSDRELYEELSCLKHAIDSAGKEAAMWHWTRAVIGLRDRIFPVSNQLRAWRESGVETVEHDIAHYDADVLAGLLGGKEDLWIKA